MSSRTARALSVIGGVCGVLALIVSVSGVASGGGAPPEDLYSDIENSPFREEVNRIGRAGCASGFPDGSFRPRDRVKRQQFAFWTNNCAGRVGHNFNFNTSAVSVPATGGRHTITSVSMTAGATDAGPAEGGFVFVTGNASGNVDAAEAALCPCELVLAISAVGTGYASSQSTTLSSVPGDEGSTASLSTQRVFPVDPGVTQDFELEAQVFDADNVTVDFVGELTALYVPFGADGDRQFTPAE